MDNWMKLKPFCQTYGIPLNFMREALHGEYRNQIGRKLNPEAKNSHYLINVNKTLKLIREKYI